jgi:hypothetical protein
MTHKGKKAVALPPSYDTTYVDPPLGTCVTTKEDAEKVIAFEATNRLETRRNMSEDMPERPYFSTPDFLRAFEKYFSDLIIDLIRKAAVLTRSLLKMMNIMKKIFDKKLAF